MDKKNRKEVWIYHSSFPFMLHSKYILLFSTYYRHVCVDVDCGGGKIGFHATNKQQNSVHTISSSLFPSFCLRESFTTYTYFFDTQTSQQKAKREGIVICSVTWMNYSPHKEVVTVIKSVTVVVLL